MLVQTVPTSGRGVDNVLGEDRSIATFNRRARTALLLQLRRSLCPAAERAAGVTRTDNRRFLNALLWMARSGSRWRDLPERLGDYATVKCRYYRWIEMGISGRHARFRAKPIWNS
jgi:transposase